MPPKPKVHPTTNTPFELIDISGNIRVCAACSKDSARLEDGPPGKPLSLLDSKICIRHKEVDYVPVVSKGRYQKTFDNKHYHVDGNCLISRNPQFNPEDVDIALVKTKMTQAVKDFLKERLR